MRLTRVQAAVSDRIDRLGREPGLPEETAAGLVTVLREAVPWDGYRLFAIDPISGDITRLLAASAGDGEMRQRWLRDAYQRQVGDPLKAHQHDARLEHGLRVMTMHEQLDLVFGMPAAQRDGLEPAMFYRSYHLHRERHHPGIRHLNAVLVNFPVGGRWVATLQAYRIDSARPFTATDIAFVRLVAPRVGEILDRSLRREQMARTARPIPAGGASGILIISRERGVEYASPAGRAWLEELSNLAEDRETLLPASIWAAVSGVGAGSEVARTTIPTATGAVSLEATAGGGTGTVGLVIRSMARETGPLPAAHWRLTPAEERVAVLVIEGLGNRAIADQLHVSEHTVEWHLRHIYDKVGVSSRSQLAARFLQDGTVAA